MALTIVTRKRTIRMKSLNLLLALVLCVTLAGCGDDDEGTATTTRGGTKRIELFTFWMK